jgi:hypothetical protein
MAAMGAEQTHTAAMGAEQAVIAAMGTWTWLLLGSPSRCVMGTGGILHGDATAIRIADNYGLHSAHSRARH